MTRFEPRSANARSNHFGNWVTTSAWLSYQYSVNYLTASTRGWSSLVEGDEGSHCQSNLVIAVDALSLLFCISINTKLSMLSRSPTRA